MEPQITTIIPTYRRPKMLRRAIESVLAQTYPHLTVAVFDNASGDETEQVVRELARRDSRVKYHCHPENVGACANFDYGLRRVETPYFSFLADDDVVFPHFYEHAMSCLDRHPEARFFCGQATIFDPRWGTHYVRPTEDWRDGLYQAAEATVRMARTFFTWTACLFSSELGRKIRFDHRVALGDVPFLIKAAAMFPFVVSLVPCGVLTSHADTSCLTMPIGVIYKSYQWMKEDIVDTEAIPAEQAARVNAFLEGHMRGLVRVRLDIAFRRGDWRTFDAAAGILLGRSGMTIGDKLRLMLGMCRRSSLFVRAARLFFGAKRYLDGLRRSGWRRFTIEELIERYAKESFHG